MSTTTHVSEEGPFKMAHQSVKRSPKPKKKPNRKNPSMAFGRNPRLVSKVPVPKKNPRRK